MVSKVQPVVSYYCRLYAVSQLLEIPKQNREKSTSQFIEDMFKKLEKEKESLNLSQNNDLNYRLVVDFADSVFVHADEEDRDRGSTMETSKAFMTAFVLYDVYSYFQVPSEEVKLKRKYAQWKAVDISKAIREGREPQRGGIGEDGTREEFEGAKDDEFEHTQLSTQKIPEEYESKPDHPSLNSLKTPLPKDERKNPSTTKSLDKKTLRDIDTFISAEEITREALSAIRFHDVQTAKDRLNAALKLLEKA